MNFLPGIVSNNKNNIQYNMNISVTIKFGTSNQVTKSYTAPVTIKQVVADAASQLGYEPNRVEASLDGVVQPDSTTLRSGDVVSVTTKPCGKAGN